MKACDISKRSLSMHVINFLTFFYSCTVLSSLCYGGLGVCLQHGAVLRLHMTIQYGLSFWVCQPEFQFLKYQQARKFKGVVGFYSLEETRILNEF